MIRKLISPFNFQASSKTVKENRLFQKKYKQELRTYFFETPFPGIYFFYKAQPQDIPQNCVKSLGNSKAKNKDPKAFLLINPWKFHILFLWYPWKFHILNPPVWIFSGTAQNFSNLVHGQIKDFRWKGTKTSTLIFEA